LMLDNLAWEHVSECLSEVDFYRYEHRMLFQMMAQLAERHQPFDVLTLSEALKERGELENVGGQIYLFELSKNTPSVANVKAYAQIVRERSVLRQLIGAANEIADLGYHPNGQSSSDILDLAEQKVFRIAEQGSRGSGPLHIAPILATTSNKIDELFRSGAALTGLSSGYADFDEMTSGLQPADLVIIAGRPSMGKTMLAMNIAENAVVETKKPVLVFSMEMPSDALAMRMISSLGQVELQRIRSGKLDNEDWPRISSTIQILSQVPLFIDDTPALTPGELRLRARRVAREHGQLQLIVVDYLQLMNAGGAGDNRTLEISEISRSLKALAKELNVPVIALSQLNRSLEQRADRRPVMSDLRESGAIEQDADLIAFIYRDEVYNPTTLDKNVAEVIIAKQRNGPIGKIKLTFRGQYTRFDNFADNMRLGNNR
jgi:replicative DNA helicase